jgi:hypothetical protein
MSVFKKKKLFKSICTIENLGKKQNRIIRSKIQTNNLKSIFSKRKKQKKKKQKNKVHMLITFLLSSFKISNF